MKKYPPRDGIYLLKDRDFIVWCYTNTALTKLGPVDHATVLKFLNKQHATTVHIPALPQTTSLIVDLYLAKKFALRVCSPYGLARKPHKCMQQLLYHHLAPSLGGWHSFTDLDLPSYQLALAASPDQVSTLINDHPLWPQLAFSENLDAIPVGLLLGRLLDPRWYIQPDSSDNLDYLYIFSLNNTVLVNKCWLTTTNKEVRSYLNNPRCFLYRTYAEYGARTAASQFLHFLFDNWLNCLCLGPQRGRLFVPEHFFRYADESKAWADYQKLATI